MEGSIFISKHLRRNTTLEPQPENSTTSKNFTAGGRRGPHCEASASYSRL